MTTEYKKAQRAAVNKAFAEKQVKLGLKSYRFSLPESVHEQFSETSELARAEHYEALICFLHDGAEELQVMAESNRAAPLTSEQYAAAEAAGMESLLQEYEQYCSLMEAAEEDALAAKEAGNRANEIRYGARAFVAASWLRIYKNKILTELKQPVDK